ncbi:MAG: ATP-binding protein [Gaiellales bacterium]
MSSPADLVSAVPPGVYGRLQARVREVVEGVARTDPNPVDPFRGLYITDDQARSWAGQTPLGGGEDARIAAAAGALGLDDLDTDVLALCAAPELSPRLGRLIAYLHDDVTRTLISPRLAARLLADGDGDGGMDLVMARFAHDAALRRRGAIDLLGADTTPLADRPVKVADRLASRLVGGPLHNPGADRAARVVTASAAPDDRPDTVARIGSLLVSARALPLVVAGPDAAPLTAVAAGRPLLLARADQAADGTQLSDLILWAALDDRLLAFEGFEHIADPGDRRRAFRRVAERVERPVVCTADRVLSATLSDGTLLTVETSLPSVDQRRRAWESLTGAADAGDVAAKFRLSLEQIAQGAEVAVLEARARGAEAPSALDLDLGARRASSGRLGELAAHLEPAYSWDDLVLPARQRAVLGSISSYLRHRDLVLSAWGYDRTVSPDQGLKVLFAGESGTGKTMAAQVLARELGLDLFRVDLATIVSKYIGETEKNLDRIFGAAEGSNAILFFDEADVLFGKRSEVRDSHDRYANIEVAYLLQKMEGYAGAVILATNFRQNLDDAFLRRLDFVIDFPFPEEEHRGRIWRRVLPSEAPVADDVDLGFLAGQFKLAGGGIRNAAVAAAFMAAEEQAPIAMRHLVRGVALEYGKLGRLTLETEFEQFHASIRPPADGAGA